MHLADLAPSIFASLGLEDAQDRKMFGTSPHGRECLLIIDGLGRNALDEFAEFAPHLARLKHVDDIETSFPSTTATSLTTLMTGELPGVHGMLGYTVRVPRSGGRILNALKWDERVDPAHWQPVPTLFERASSIGIKVSHVAAKRYESTGFTQAAFRGAHYLGANALPEMIDKARQSLRTTPSFTYVYVNELDVAGHSHGEGSSKWLDALAQVDQVVDSLLKALPTGTRFWITSDHGMVNVKEKIILGRNNPLMDGVETVAGEPRARHIYLEEKYANDDGMSKFAQVWRDYLGDRATVVTKNEVQAAQLFGPLLTEDAQDRMGDIIAISRSEIIMIDALRENLETKMVGHHGAQTESERIVPLLVSTIGD